MSIGKRFVVIAVLLSSILFSQSVFAGSLFQFQFTPEKPALGDQVTLLVTLRTLFSGSDGLKPVVVGTIDGMDVSALNPAEKVWYFRLGTNHLLGEHEFKIKLYLERKNDADKLRLSIKILDDEIKELKFKISYETDPDIKMQLIAERSSKILSRNSLVQALPGLREKIVTETVKINIDSNLRMSPLKRNIVLAQNHNLLIQNDDAGYNYYVTDPGELHTRDDVSPQNQYGLHGLSLIESYKVSGESSNLKAIERIADTLMTRPVARCVRLYSNDSEFLYHSQDILGFNYRQKAIDSLNAEKSCTAAYEILDNINPNNSEIDAIEQSVLDGVTDVQRVARFRERLIFAGRNAGLRAFDWGSRVRAYLAIGDTAFAKAIADVVANDAHEIIPDNFYYLLGHSNTILALKHFVDIEPSFQAIIENSKNALLATQQPDGLFQVIKNDVIEEGTVQDQAFIADALFQIGETDSLKLLIDAMIGYQTPAGAYFFFNYEFVEGQSEFLEVISRIYQKQTEFSESVVVPRKSRRYSKNSKKANPFK